MKESNIRPSGKGTSLQLRKVRALIHKHLDRKYAKPHELRFSRRKVYLHHIRHATGYSYNTYLRDVKWQFYCHPQLEYCIRIVAELLDKLHPFELPAGDPPEPIELKPLVESLARRVR